MIKVEGFVIQFCYPIATLDTADLKSSMRGDYYRGDLRHTHPVALAMLFIDGLYF